MARVSPSAVSRYLNGGSLSQEKRLAIRQAIDQTGYQPDQVAHTLRTGHIRQVGVIVPRIHSQSVSQVIEGVNSVLSQADYLPVLGSTEERREREARYLEMMQSYRMAGILLMATSVTPEQLRLYRACAIPLVVTGQNIPELSCVFHDDFNAMRELGQRLLERGRRHICYIGVREEDPAAGRTRRLGVQAALDQAGLPGEAMPTEISSFELEGGVACMRRLLERCPEVDGVLCATDTIAQGAMLALRQAGRRIPEEVSVAGVGDDWADLVSLPCLTTARLYQRECGREAASMLLQMIQRQGSAAPVRQVMLGYTILERGSV